MKRNLLYGVLAVAGLSLLACQNMEQDLSEAVNVPDTRTVFYAEIEQSEDTKVYADEDLMILWHADDRISIFNRYTYNLEYRFGGETGANAGAFRAVPNDDMIVGNALDAIYAVYPYDEQTSISNQGMLSVMLPEKQEYAENSFGRGANYMVSSTYNNRLLFRNVCGYLSVKLYGEGVSVSRITLRGNAGEKLSGKGSIDAPVGGIPVLTMSGDAGEEVSLVCPEPVKLGASADEYTEFWFAIPPTEFEQGLTVTVYDDGFGSFEKSTSTPISVTRSNLSRLSPVEAEIVTPEQPNNEIWYTTTDGEVVAVNYPAAFNVNLVSNTYENGLGIIRFEEALTEIGDGAFWGCPFVTLQLPSSLQVIRDQAFGSCRYLETLDIPKSVTEIGSYNCFAYCKSLASFTGKFATEDHKALIVDGTMVGFAQSGLTEYTVDDSVVILGSVFAGCSELTSISLPSTIEEIRNEAFESCTGLTELTLPNSLVSLGYNAFRGCSGLQTICIPDGVTFIGSNCFDGCSSLSSFTGKYASEEGRCLIEDTRMIGVALSGARSLSIPEGVTETCTIKGYDELESIVFPSTITTLGQVSYCNGLQSIVMHMTTPPSSFIRSQWFSNLPWLFLYTNDCPVYVPALSVSTYKEADVWCDYADRIHSLGEAQVAVDLGLPSGVKWASYNVGALSPEGAGAFFAWGETTPKTYFTEDNYTVTKYKEEGGLLVLEAEDDAASAYLGDGWRIPTHEDWMELKTNTTKMISSVNGVNGYLFTSNINGSSIFLPFVKEQSADSVTGYYFYWSSTGKEWDPNNGKYYAWSYALVDGDLQYSHYNYGCYRSSGLPIRPVTE